jgi:nucleoside-diphosphate-sugar epimerase
MGVLIVGGAGEVGQYLVKALSHKGRKLTILDRAPNHLWLNKNLPLTYKVIQNISCMLPVYGNVACTGIGLSVVVPLPS